MKGFEQIGHLLHELSSHYESCRILNIIDIREYNNNIEILQNIVSNISEKDKNVSILKQLMKDYGTYSFSTFLQTCFDKRIYNQLNCSIPLKIPILEQYFHPLGYYWTQHETIMESTISFSHISNPNSPFHVKCNGLNIHIPTNNYQKTLTIFGVFDPTILLFLNNDYLREKKRNIWNERPNQDIFHNSWFQVYIDSLMMNDLFVFDNHADIYIQYKKGIEQCIQITEKPIAHTVKEFLTMNAFEKRNILMKLLIRTDIIANTYLAYLLYDLLSNESEHEIDTKEQLDIYNSFPWTIKETFKQSMNQTIEYTKRITNYDANKIPVEQQVCLMKAPDSVKEKAFSKIKEIKTKGEDSGAKAKQYIDGLLKIPFEVYKKEKILTIMNETREQFRLLHENNHFEVFKKETPTILDIMKSIQQINPTTIQSIYKTKLSNIIELIQKSDRVSRNEYIARLNTILQTHKITNVTILRKSVTAELEKYRAICDSNPDVLRDTIESFYHSTIEKEIDNIHQNISTVQKYMKNIRSILDESVYGHNNAKTQIERILGQWINGELDGHCFGFEGAPGIGKTSMAKNGIANCLLDENSEKRPFAMIQMGGDSNGSTLHGHNYTYVGSTWGSIVQILMDKQCMNPIIFIDEVDKISKTEQGKEIVGILTHLLDSTQNDCFQDKYFNGIDLNLSKALFILSYNDPNSIDSILLDRIHRIQFEHLSLQDKLVICKNHLLPEIFQKMGLMDIIEIEDTVLQFIIENYTSESGVRKLKEILFDIVGDINVNVLKCAIDFNEQEKIHITIHDIQNKYLKERHPIHFTKIHTSPSIGIINGLWANALGMGGIIPIQTSWKPSNQFMELTLTGTQGNTMKESMNVALTLAWKLTSEENKQIIIQKYAQSGNLHGIHIHCPDTSTPKDGPSAGTAITVVIYSLLNQMVIDNTIAITGEICLNGNVTEIGSLAIKIKGAIRAGVKHILYPQENARDYLQWIQKHSEESTGITFTEIKTIEDVIQSINNIKQ